MELMAEQLIALLCDLERVWIEGALLHKLV